MAFHAMALGDSPRVRKLALLRLALDRLADRLGYSKVPEGKRPASPYPSCAKLQSP